jgi:hypothetical protein
MQTLKARLRSFGNVSEMLTRVWVHVGHLNQRRVKNAFRISLGTHHIVFQLNPRSHAGGPKFFLANYPDHSVLKFLTGLATAALMAW